jgi:hypothetical protein
MKTLTVILAVSACLSAQDWRAVRIVGMAEYPVLARHAGISGRVLLHCVSKVDTEPPICSVISGHEVLGRAAKGNAEQWRFRVANESAAGVDLIYDFRLTQSGSTRERPLATFVFTSPNVITVTSAQGCSDHLPCPANLNGNR